MPIKRYHFILLMIAVILVISAAYYRFNTKKYMVQDFTGSPYTEVADWVESNSVPTESVVLNYVYSETVPKNTVVSQNIAANHTISGNNKLVVTVSKGTDPNRKIKLIDFSEMDQDAITEWFEKNKIEDYQFIFAINEYQPEGFFLSCDPPEGTRILRNEPVTVTMCLHDHSSAVALPDFSGKTVSDIQEWADPYDITVNFIYYFDDSENGTFLFSDVPAGTEIEKGGYLSVAVSAGPGT